MAKISAMPLWTDAYLADTTHLTTIQHGIFLLLLMSMWRSKGQCLPNDDVQLAKFARLRMHQWKQHKPVIMPLFTVHGELLYNRRLSDEYAFVSAKIASAVRAGKASALKRLNRDATDVGHTLQRKSNAVDDPLTREGNLTTPTPITSLSMKPEVGHEVAPQDDVVDEVWRVVKPWLSRFYGDDRSGGMTGRLLKHGNPRQVLIARAAAEESKSQDPYPYMIQALTNQVACQQLDSGQWRIAIESRQGKAWRSHAKRCRDEKVLGMFTYGDGFITVSKEWPGQN